ncbi:hypothetical protein ACIPVK_00120 [Paeniglutamicibacter sp. MACA_103]|uniref:hypothetical protein n=1 Tax=Paeniglutamicibacter sp. MACA_103 TaxID=3377337 RepID=UPI003893C2F9
MTIEFSEFGEADIAEISGQRTKSEFIRAGSGSWAVIYEYEGIEERHFSARTFPV